MNIFIRHNTKVPAEYTRQGFSMIELITYIALASLMFGALISFVGLLLQSHNQQVAVSEVEHQGVFIVDQITQTIRNAEIINFPFEGEQGNTLSLNMPFGTESPVVFSMSEGIVYTSQGGGVEIPLTSDRVQVVNFTVDNFTRPDTPGVVRMSVTLQYVHAGNNTEESYEQTFYGNAALR